MSCSLLVTDCGPLENPKQGRVTFQSTTVTSTATYSCNKGYLLVGVATRTCRSNGEWSGSAPLCEAQVLRCNPLPNIGNGRVFATGDVVGSAAVYACDLGFQLVGENRRTCQSDGEWSLTEPFCRKSEHSLIILSVKRPYL